VLDFGSWWREKTGLPLPLGGNAIKRDLGPELMREVSLALKDSIQYGLNHRDEALAYAMQFARDLDRQLASRFVSMYVNERTLDYGAEGRKAITRLLEMGHEKGIIREKPRVEFID
jgi:1,4-dihydroxy-6-naphthoate synthase